MDTINATLTVSRYRRGRHFTKTVITWQWLAC